MTIGFSNAQDVQREYSLLLSHTYHISFPNPCTLHETLDDLHPEGKYLFVSEAFKFVAGLFGWKRTKKKIVISIRITFVKSQSRKSV